MKVRPLLVSAGFSLFLGLNVQVLEVLAETNVYGGARHSYLVDQNGSAFGWGDNGFYQLGYKESTTTVRSPEQILFKDNSQAKNIKMFSSSKSNYFTLAMMEDGTLRFWGSIFSYDGGLGGYWSDTDYSNYITIQNQDGTPFKGASDISSGDVHMAALRSDGTVWTWGQNVYGQLGNGKTEHSPYPNQVLLENGSPLTDVVAISSGAWHTLALKKDGTVYGWGWNKSKQIGESYPAVTPYAVPILQGSGTPLFGVTGIEAGAEHSLALKFNNGVLSWGSNSFGQLGDGGTLNRSYPAYVLDENRQPLEGVKSIKTSGYSSYALTNDSNVLAWGRNQLGQLGHGNITSFNGVPGYVMTANGTALEQVYSFSAGFQHVLALQKDGAVWGWGSNVGNTLGVGETNGGGIPNARRVLNQAEEPLTIQVEENTLQEEVKNPTVTLQNRQALLQWEKPNNAVRYVEIYKNGTYMGTSPSTIYVDPTVDPSVSHTYTLKAVDSLGNKTAGVNAELKIVHPVKMIEVKMDKTSPQTVKSTVTIDALAEGGNERFYKFWVLENGVWKVLQDYSTANSVKWTPLQEGNYKISVHVKDRESSKSYDDYKAFEYKIESASVLLNSFSSQLPSPRSIYSSISLTASATGGSEKLYKFFAYHNGVWTVIQDFSPSSTVNWIPKFTGDYKLVVHAKDKNSTKSYDSYKQLMFKVINGPIMQSLSTSLASPQPLGKTIQIKVLVTGGTEMLYKYWVYDGVKWHVLKDFSTQTTFDWKPSAKGTYKISVHVKDKYSTRSYDSYKALNYTIK